MFDLASRYWDWRAVKLEEQKTKLEAKRCQQLVKNKYGKWLKMVTRAPLYPVDPVMNLMFEQCIESGVSSVKRQTHYCEAEFNNGFHAKFWIANKPYAYASKETTFKSPLGTEIKFLDNTMPDMYMVHFIEEKVEKFSKFA